MAELLRCGHSANSTRLLPDGSRKPSCVICAGLRPGWDQPAPEQPDLSSRKARCCDAQSIVPSSLELAFFEHRPTMEYDRYYCGHAGWD